MSGLIHTPVRKDVVYRKMLDEIQGAILSGKLPPQSRILSEPELCERYGISRVSVRTALAQLEKNGFIVKKTGLGSFVCDPDNSAFSPHLEVHDVALNITSLNLNVSWYYAKIYKAAVENAPRFNVKLSVVSQVSSRTLVPSLWKGLLAISRDCDREIETIAERGIQVMLFNRISHHPDIASVYVDYFEESYRAVRCLLERGHKRIALITPYDGGAIFRAGGYLKALDRSFPEPDLLCNLIQNRPDAEYTAAVIEYLKHHRPDAVYIPYGAHFLPFAAAVNQLRLRIPEDLEVFTFDDIGDMKIVCNFPFGYVKMPLAEMTNDALEYLAGKISGKESIPVLHRKYSASLEFCN